MHKTLTLLVILLLAVASITVLPTKAQGRIIVVPDDYTTIEDAIAVASDGDTILFRDGNWSGPINQTITINKQLTLIGQSPQNTLITLYPAYNETWLFATPLFDYTDALAVTADNFKIINLKIEVRRPGGTISLNGNGLQILNSDITVGYSTGIEITGSFCKVLNNTIVGGLTVNGTYNEVARNTQTNYIYTYGSYNLIKNNNCGSLGLFNSSNNLFLSNKMITSSCLWAGVDMSLSTNNFFFKNEISGYQSGFRFWFSSGNTIVANTVTGIFEILTFGGSPGNIIHHNNFINNNNLTWVREYVRDNYNDRNYRNANPNMTISYNMWNDESLGNFWGNYNGMDGNGDGIGDTPYIINITNYDFRANETDFSLGQDNFPLMNMVDLESVTVDLPGWVSNLPPEPQAIDPKILLPRFDSATFNDAIEPPTQNQQEPASTVVDSTLPIVLVLVSVACLITMGLIIFYKRNKQSDRSLVSEKN